MSKLIQPINVFEPSPGRDKNEVLSIDKFLELLKEEEDYWESEENNTKLIISKLRKIFYDKWGWNKELIQGAAQVETRYQTVMKKTAEGHAKKISGPGLIYTPVYRQITYTDHDRVYGDSKKGEVPYIYQHDHQEVKLREGNFCDLAHVLAGLDALNHKQVVSPLPSFIRFLYKLFPYVSANVDVVTWVGDIASSSADFLFDYIKNGKKELSLEEQQKVINDDASGADMLGDIDPYVIARNYNIGTDNGQRLTEILTDFYIKDCEHRNNRFLQFAEEVGLKGWDGTNFSNEKKWQRYYYKQLKNCITFVIFSQNEKTLRGILLPIKVWFGGYKKILKIDELILIFLEALKKEINSTTP